MSRIFRARSNSIRLNNNYTFTMLSLFCHNCKRFCYLAKTKAKQKTKKTYVIHCQPRSWQVHPPQWFGPSQKVSPALYPSGHGPVKFRQRANHTKVHILKMKCCNNEQWLKIKGPKEKYKTWAERTRTSTQFRGRTSCHG